VRQQNACIDGRCALQRSPIAKRRERMPDAVQASDAHQHETDALQQFCRASSIARVYLRIGIVPRGAAAATALTRQQHAINRTDTSAA